MTTPTAESPRPKARIVIEWDPDSGTLNYQANGANGMEQLGCLVHAQHTLWASLQKTLERSPLLTMPSRLFPPGRD